MIANASSALLIVVVAVIACESTGCGEPVPFRTVAKGTFSGLTEPRQEVIRDKAAWTRLWSRHDVTVRPQSSIPEINFAKEMVVVVAMGQKPAGGYSIEVVKIEMAKDRLKVFVSRVSPPPGSMTLQALTTPFHMVTIAKCDAKPQFEDSPKH